MDITATLQAVDPEPIYYKRGLTYVKLEGFNAWLYRGMIAMYGMAEATDRFWWLWHKKSDVTTPDDVAVTRTGQPIYH